MSHPDLTRTVAALAAYDELDREFMRAPTCECEAFVESLHTAQKAIGDAFSSTPPTATTPRSRARGPPSTSSAPASSSCT